MARYGQAFKDKAAQRYALLKARGHDVAVAQER